MKNIVVIICLIMGSNSFAQATIGGYDFIVVPDRFEFLSGDNKYQLSDMLVFYLEKKEIKVYREAGSPDVPKCKALYADMSKKSSAFSTKLTFILRDCKNNIVFKSKEAISKLKQIPKAYPDATRKVLATFTKSDIEIAVASQGIKLNENKKQVVQNKTVLEPETKVKKVISETPEKFEDRSTAERKTMSIPKITDKTVGILSEIALPEAAFTNYTLAENSYLLKKEIAGYTLFLVQEGSDKFVKVGELTLTEGAAFNMVDIYGDNKSGYFNENQDLLIELANGKKIVYVKKP